MLKLFTVRLADAGYVRIFMAVEGVDLALCRHVHLRRRLVLSMSFRRGTAFHERIFHRSMIYRGLSYGLQIEHTRRAFRGSLYFTRDVEESRRLSTRMLFLLPCFANQSMKPTPKGFCEQADPFKICTVVPYSDPAISPGSPLSCALSHSRFTHSHRELFNLAVAYLFLVRAHVL